MFAHYEQQHVPTEFGTVVVWRRKLEEKGGGEEGGEKKKKGGVVFVQRHKTQESQEYELPHNVRHGAIGAALAAAGCRRVVGVCSVGSLSSALPPGMACVPSDYVNLWGCRSALLDAAAHIAPRLDAALRSSLLSAALSVASSSSGAAVYVQTRGPRFETAAEVRFLATLGDVVGMTAADEATHCQERGLAYAMLAMVDNWANGLEPPAAAALSLETFRQAVKNNEHTVQTILRAAITSLGFSL